MKHFITISMFCVAICLAGCNKKASDPIISFVPASGEALTPGVVFVSVVHPSDDNADPILYPEENIDTNLYSISFDNTPLNDVVRDFCKITGANIIAAPANLQGRVTARLDEVGWQSALETILDMHGLLLSESPPGSKIFRIDPKSDVGEPYIIKVVFLETEEQAVEMAAALPEAIGNPPGFHAVALPSRKAIILNATWGQLSQVREIMSIIKGHEKD